MPYVEQDKLQKLARAYGEHNIHSGNGKLIEYEAIAAAIGGLIIKARLALGESPFHSIEKASYDGADVDLSHLTLYKESGDVVSSGTAFPTRVLNPGASFVDYDLPAEMANDAAPDKLVIRAKCLEIADYNSSGTQIGFGYSDDAARVAADGILHLGYEHDDIDWESWAAFKAFTSALINVVIDGVTVAVPRFPLNIFLIPQWDLDHFLDRVCQLTCSDWTWKNSKICFIPPVDRTASFNFNPSNIAKIFKFQAVQGDALYNGIRISWRDIHHPLLIEGEPIVVDRRIDPNEPENFYEINAGNCRQDVAERIAHYNAKIKCDLTDFALIRSSFSGYTALPGDIVTITHPTPAWTNKRCKVLRKSEREDRESVEGIEKFIGYGFYVQVEPSNPYSDTDHTPMVTRAVVTGLNKFSPSPAIISLTLSESVVKADDGSINISIVGVAEFDNFAFAQRGKAYFKKVGGAYEQIPDLFPDADKKAQFRIPNLKAGDYKVKIVTFNDYFKGIGVQQTAPVIEYLKTLDGKDDPPSPVTGFTLTYDGTQYVGKFTAPLEADIDHYNVYDGSNTKLFQTYSTYFTYQSPNPGLTLKVDVEDTSKDPTTGIGNRSTKVSASYSLPACVIEKIGIATLDSVSVGITNYPVNARFRRIKISASSGMTSPATEIIDFSDTINLLKDRYVAQGTGSELHRYIQISHSFDNVNWITDSNILDIHFFNEAEAGVPLIDGIGKLDLIQNSWIFTFDRPYKNGNVARTSVELMLINNSKFALTSGFHSSSADMLTTDYGFRDLNGNFPASGMALLQNMYGREIISYTSHDADHLYGVTRGLFGTTPMDFDGGTGVWFLGLHEDLGNTVKFTYPQLADNYYAFFRWVNDYGYSDFIFMGEVFGTISGATPATAPDPPPAVPPDLPVGYENPFSSEFDKYARARELPIDY